MNKLKSLVFRNVKLFFKDKGMFFTSLITPAILLVLYATFLANVYKDAFLSSLPPFVELEESLINGCVAGQLLSSLLAVSCVTVSFCSNLLMVQDKLSGARDDIMMTPVKKSTVAISYYLATLITTLIVCYFALALSLIYVACVGWYMSVGDVLLLILDVFLLSMFGTALSSCVNVFLSTQGQMSAVGTIVSSCYGFICGAYMPISSFSEGLQKVVSMLPGTYGTSLIRNHAMSGVFSEMADVGVPSVAIDGLKTAVDCSIDFFGTTVEVGAMYAVLTVTVAVLVALFVLIHKLTSKKK